MAKRQIARSINMIKGILDDNYYLFDNGEILHEYDKSQYLGQFGLSETLSIEQVNPEILDDFVKSATNDDLELVKRLIGR